MRLSKMSCLPNGGEDEASHLVKISPMREREERNALEEGEKGRSLKFFSRCRGRGESNAYRERLPLPAALPCE